MVEFIVAMDKSLINKGLEIYLVASKQNEDEDVRLSAWPPDLKLL